MFGFDQDKRFQDFNTNESNEYGHNPGSLALDPFHSGGDTSAASTTFGQSFGFANQPPLPLGGLAKAPQISGSYFGNKLSVSPDERSETFNKDTNGLSTAATGGIQFTNKNVAQNLYSSPFGSTAFEETDYASFSPPTASHTTFERTSSFGEQAKHRSSEFGRGAQDTRPSDNGFSVFGGTSTHFGEKGTTFGENENGYGGQQRVNEAVPFHRGQESFSQESRGLQFSNETFSSTSTSKGTAFGSQSLDDKARTRRSVSNATASFPVDNPFTTTASSYSATNDRFTHTTFDEAAGGYNTNASVVSQKPFLAGSAAPTTTFGGVKEKRRQSAVKARERRKMDKMQARTSRRKAQFSFSESDVEDLMAANDAKFSQAQTGMLGHSPDYASIKSNEATKASKRTSEKHGKRRQARPKKKLPVTSDDDIDFFDSAYLPPVGDETTKAQLSAAKNLDGLCTDMCSPAERELHIRVDELSVFEKCFPDRPGREREMIIKRFQRSSADHKLDIPEEIRPLGVLRRTQLYIEQSIMDLDHFGLDPRFQYPRVPEPIELYNFCWDRFRMIRKDIVLQNYRGAGGRVHPIALDIHERIARYHVLSEHELSETPSFVAQQNMEQLGQTLKSLNELYDESHKLGDPAYWSPFEAECRAYFILCTLDNGRGMDVLKYVKDLPYHILQSDHIKFAMRVFVARHTSDYFQFFMLLREATYLQSCLIFRYIPSVRSSALLRMNRAYRSQTYSLEYLADLLCFDDTEQAYAVCREHQLEISGTPSDSDDGDDSGVMVKFGGNFQTDAQLRRNNTPLKIRRSKIFIGIKQGSFLRRDVCRGATEYPRNKYPVVSKLIYKTEIEERSRLYPDQPVYRDPYSCYIEEVEGLVDSPPMSPIASANTFFGQHEPAETDQYSHDLGMIAERKYMLEQDQQDMLERMQGLEQTKEESSRWAVIERGAAIEAAQYQEQLRQERIAQAKAENVAAEVKLHQQKLEAQLREQTKLRELAEQRALERQRELEQQRKIAEEIICEAERQRVAALQQVQAIKLQVAKEEQRRQEKKRQKEARQAAEQLERRRQQDLAETKARQAREAAYEAQRQAQLAKEQEEKKRARRVAKQRLAILKLRLHLWKKYVQVSRRGMDEPILIDVSKLRFDRPHRKAKESIQWLLGSANGAVGTMTGTKRLKDVSKVEEDVLLSDSDILAVWRSENIVGLVGTPLCQQNPGIPLIAWKLVIADLLDEASSSFGLWCAVRAGAQNVFVPKHDCYRVFQKSNNRKQEIVVCSRYLDSTFTERNTHEAQQDKLSATSAILLPVDMSVLELAGNCSRWEQRIEELLSTLKSGSRVTLFALGFVLAEVKSSREVLINMLGGCVERVKSRFASLIVHVSVDVIDAGHLLPHEFSQVLKKVATVSPRAQHLKSVGFKELLEDSMKATMNHFESSMGMQSSMCTIFPRLREDILTSGMMDLTYPPPELQSAIVEPPRGWNSQERRHEIRSILTALEVTRITLVDSPLNPDEACDVYFKKVEDFIDRLFGSYPAATAVSTYELKKRIYSVFLPIHERLKQKNKTEQVTLQATDVLVPWRKVFEEIYTTFFETLSDLTIYYPAECGEFGANVSRFRDTATHLSAPKQFTVHQRNSKRARDDAEKRVQVSAESIRRSFGPLYDVEVSKQKCTAARLLKRLRVAIDKEQVASFMFQRMLRQALKEGMAT